MTNSVVNSIVGFVGKISLIDGIAKDEYVIDTDGYKQERHQLVNTSGAGSTEEHEAETCSIGENYAYEASQGKNASAVDRAKATNECKCITTYCKDGKDDKVKIIVDVVRERFDQTLQSKQVCIGMNECLFPLQEFCDDLVLEGIKEAFVDIILI